MKKRGLLVVVSSPSGGGKGTILKELFRRNENLKMSVSATTRAPRPGEEHGVHYYFITKDEFKTNIENHAMLEYAEYCDNFYGTPKAPVEKWLEEGHDVVLEIEVQGGRQIKKVAPDCVSLFILPPSLKVLEKRLRGRGTETEEVIEKRLAAAKHSRPSAIRQGKGSSFCSCIKSRMSSGSIASVCKTLPFLSKQYCPVIAAKPSKSK